jgi:hypothetical protein
MATRNALNKAQKQSQVADRELRSNLQKRKPVPISSHPDADPEVPVPPDSPQDAPVAEDFRRGPDAERPKPIVSINGNDVDEPEESDCNAA